VGASSSGKDYALDMEQSVSATDERAANEVKKRRLREIIRTESLLVGGDFKLASGERSQIFFNMKKTMLDPEGANLLGDLILDLLREDGAKFIGGLAVGAVPLVTIVVVKSWPGQPIRAFFVRREQKGHGTNQTIDGYVEDGSRVVMFDDVTTTGGSVMEAVRAVRERGCKVSKVITIVDRLEGARDNLAREGITLVPLFTRHDFIGE
jgi:orotate phosphoribosyltransferase